MGKSRYGITMGRPTQSKGGARVHRNIKLDPEVDGRVVAFQAQEKFDSYTKALEWLLKRGLRGVEEAEPYRTMAHNPGQVIRDRVEAKREREYESEKEE